MRGPVPLSEARWKALDRLARVSPDMAFLVGGNQRIACAGLVDHGLAVQVGAAVDVRAAYKITEAGRERYALGQNPKDPAP